MAEDKHYERRERMIGWEVDKNGVVKVTFDQKADHFIMEASDLRRFAEGLLDAADRADEITGQEDAPLVDESPCVVCALVVFARFAKALSDYLEDDKVSEEFEPMEEWSETLEAFEPIYEHLKDALEAHGGPETMH
jgi:hypothetical protein